MGSPWWAPRTFNWWTAVLFMIGSACFALGAAPGYAGAVGPTADTITFFVGSLFFTSAAFLQYVGTVNPPDGTRRRRVLTWEPKNPDWWAASVQLLGTVFFNMSTGAAMIENLSARQADRLIWRPDAFGSICFLVASGVAWAVVSHGWRSWRPGRYSWWTAALNLAGSIAFGISAVASYVVPDSGLPRNAKAMNAGTFIGALCFLVGALLMLPRQAGAEQQPVA